MAFPFLLHSSVFQDIQYGEESVMAGIIQPLIEILSSPLEMNTNPDVVIDSVRILAKLSEDTNNARALGESIKVLSQITMLLSSYQETIRLHAALILAHLSKVEENRSRIREAGALRALITCVDHKVSNLSDLSSGEISVQQQALQEWSLAAIQQLAQDNTNREILSESIPVIVGLLSSKNNAVIEHAAGTIDLLASTGSLTLFSSLLFSSLIFSLCLSSLFVTFPIYQKTANKPSLAQEVLQLC
jgi:hypothetical protein